ncbi:MAG TPA: hypothetical protein VLT58_10205, partial [Polyangia bacterium]|nr:hypothetical protein [Polyangia bacterium]
HTGTGVHGCVSSPGQQGHAKFGYACSAAMDQLQDLESRAAAFGPEQQITVTGFELPEGF